MNWNSKHWLTRLAALLVAGSLVGGVSALTGCEENTRDGVGDDIEKIGEDIEDAADDARDNAEDAVDDTADEIDDAVN